MVDKVLNPSEVGIACGRHPILPAGIAAELVATPIAVVERRIGHHKISLHITMRIVEERSLGVPLHLRGIDATDSQIHLGQDRRRIIRIL